MLWIAKSRWCTRHRRNCKVKIIVQFSYNFACCRQKTAFLLRNLMEARVGIEAEDRTGAIEFIGFSSSQIQQNSHSIQMQAQI